MQSAAVIPWAVPLCSQSAWFVSKWEKCLPWGWLRPEWQTDPRPEFSSKGLAGPSLLPGQSLQWFPCGLNILSVRRSSQSNVRAWCSACAFCPTKVKTQFCWAIFCQCVTQGGVVRTPLSNCNTCHKWIWHGGSGSHRTTQAWCTFHFHHSKFAVKQWHKLQLDLTRRRSKHCNCAANVTCVMQECKRWLNLCHGRPCEKLNAAFWNPPLLSQSDWWLQHCLKCNKIWHTCAPPCVHVCFVRQN